MPLVFPVISYLLLVAILQRSAGLGLRDAVLRGAVIAGMLLVVMTELLSVATLLKPTPVAIAWGTIALVLAVGFLRSLLSTSGPRLRRDWHWDWKFWPVVVIAGLVLIVGVVALLAPPNTWDSMTYHMGRVVHWIQNGSVAPYPTHIPRQLYQPPGAEFAIAHFQILSSGDRFANMVQWLSFIGGIVGVSKIAQQLGVDVRGQVAAAVFGATIPMAVLQASSTKNDLACAFWLVCFVYFGLRVSARTDEPPPWLDAVALGGSLGLALLTKSTAYVFALPFIVWLGARMALGATRGRFWQTIGIVATVAIALNAGVYHRNYTLYRSPLGPASDTGPVHFTNDELSVRALTSNALRNIGLHLGTASALDDVSEQTILTLHRWIGADPNDPATTWPGPPFSVPPPSTNEGNAGNPLHLILIIIALGVVVARTRDDGDRPIPDSGYVAALIAGFLFFCLVLKWQPWHSRLQLPLFVLAAPLVGAALASVRLRRLLPVMNAMLFVGAVPCVIGNSARPLVGSRSVWRVPRSEQYFANGPTMLPPYLEMSEVVRGSSCDDVGLVVGSDDWEYPMWQVLARPGRPLRIEHVRVANATARAYVRERFAAFLPCSLVRVGPNPEPWITVRGVTFVPSWRRPGISVFMPVQRR